jgi:hypothetical protein
MVPKGFKAISAGFCDIIDGHATVDINSKSESLKLKASQKDEVLIQTWLTFGESMLIMVSAVYLSTNQ